MIENVGIFVPKGSDYSIEFSRGRVFKESEYVEYDSVFDLWQRAYDFFIHRDSSWAFLFASGDVDIDTSVDGHISLHSFGNLYKEVIPFIFDNGELYDEYCETFFDVPINDGKSLYLTCLDLIGIINSIRRELSFLYKYDVDKYGYILNAIAIARVRALQELSKKVQKNEESNFSIIHVGKKCRV